MKFTLFKQMVVRSINVDLINNEIYAEDNLTHLKAKYKLMFHHLYTQMWV